MINRISQGMEQFSIDLCEFIKEIPIKTFDRNFNPNVIVVLPDYYWGELSARQAAVQLKLKRTYETLYELCRLILGQAPNNLLKQLEKVDKKFRSWIELERNWSLTANADNNLRLLAEVSKEFQEIAAVLKETGEKQVILIPDTNALLTQPDPMRYRKVAGDNAFVFLLLPTVLSELDKLKIEHRNQDVREKAKKVIMRIKGWRSQGGLRDGVLIDKSIIVKATHSEPDMDNSLSWLDQDVADDRIIASVLESAAQNPASHIVLVTGDINLQNKADAALIQIAEIPVFDSDVIQE